MPKKYVVNNGANPHMTPRESATELSAIELEMEATQNSAENCNDSKEKKIPIDLEDEAKSMDETDFTVSPADSVEGSSTADDKTDASDSKGEGEGDEDSEEEEATPCCALFLCMDKVRNFLSTHKAVIWKIVGIIIFLLYLAYTIYALYRKWGTEGSARLIILLILVMYSVMVKRIIGRIRSKLPRVEFKKKTAAQMKKTARWSLYVMVLGGAVAFVAVEIVPRQPSNLISLAGLAACIIVSFIFSAKPAKVNWHTVFWGTAMQFYLAIFLLRTSVGFRVFTWVGDRIVEFLAFTDAGSIFLFGKAYTMHPIVFQTLPVVIYLNAAMAIAYHFGLVQGFVSTFGRALAFCLDTTPVESVNAAGNIFLSMMEAPLLIRPFLDTCSESELFAIMTGGAASIAGSAFAIYVNLGVPSDHLLAASVMSAPAALAVAKIMYPETRRRKKNEQDVYNIKSDQPPSLIEAVARAATSGAQIVVSAAATALVFVALLALLDGCVNWFGNQAGVEGLTFQRLISYPFYPVAFLCGADIPDLLVVARLTAVKITASSFLAYQELGVLQKNTRIFNDYQLKTNGTWDHVGNDVILNAWNQTLAGGVLTERSVVLTVYILCGFSSVLTVAITIGLLAGIIPKRVSTVTRLAIPSFVAANISCFMTACVAGLMFI